MLLGVDPRTSVQVPVFHNSANGSDVGMLVP